VIHVIAEQATILGSGTGPGSEVAADGLITPELVQEIARSAKLVPLIYPTDAPPEKGYVPSRALADFVRCRDMTCRRPGVPPRPRTATWTIRSPTRRVGPPTRRT
jgi:Domain of unknown function (DUF222)